MATQAALLRQRIEAKLAHRIPAALSPLPPQAARLHTTGNAPLDLLLGGGLPLGTVCEITGPEGSGHSAIALSLLAQAASEAACAYIDVADRLSPHSAAAAGVRLQNMLWVRCAATARQAEKPAKGREGLPPKPDAGREVTLPSGGGRHPRQETRGLAPALEQMLFDKKAQRSWKMEGTPGYPNQPLGLATASQEQIAWERFNLRKADESDPLRQSDRAAADAARQRAAVLPIVGLGKPSSEQKPGDRLDRALRAADLILHSGGFRLVVLDLASVATEQALRIPSATWFRFRKAAQESDAVVLLLTREPCARSAAACVLTCSPGTTLAIHGVLSAVTQTAEIARQRAAPVFGNKAPGRVASWDAAPAWMRAVGK